MPYHSGDSGGPALFFDGYRNQQIGVVHGNIANCDGTTYPNIFVRLDNPEVFDWITKVTTGTYFYTCNHGVYILTGGLTLALILLAQLCKVVPLFI